MQFVAKVFDPHSCAVHEVPGQSPSAHELRKRLELEGKIVLDIAAARSTKSPSAGASGGALDIAWWCRELKTLLLAGMTVVEALDTLKAQSVGTARTGLHTDLVQSLQAGQALSSAMEATGVFPIVLIAGVKASERTSTLVESLDDYLRYHELLEGLRKKVISAAIYPCVVFALGLIITIFLMIFVIPRFAQIYTDRQTSVGMTTQALLWTSKLLNQHGSVVGIALASAMALLVGAWRRGAIHRLASALAERIGPLRRQINEFRLAKLYQAMTLMIRGGYAVAEALQQCAELNIHPSVRQRVQQARQDLLLGRRVSSALTNANLTDNVSSRLLAVGERTGDFDRILQTIAQRHASNFATFVERATRIVEPVMLLIVSALVGGVVMMMYMPMFDIASSVR